MGIRTQTLTVWESLINVVLAEWLDKCSFNFASENKIFWMANRAWPGLVKCRQPMLQRRKEPNKKPVCPPVGRARPISCNFKSTSFFLGSSPRACMFVNLFQCRLIFESSTKFLTCICRFSYSCVCFCFLPLSCSSIW